MPPHIDLVVGVAKKKKNHEEEHQEEEHQIGGEEQDNNNQGGIGALMPLLLEIIAQLGPQVEEN